MRTSIRLKKVAASEMLNHPEGEYNMNTWNKAVNRIVDTMKDVTFYVRDKETSENSYTEFFASYVIPEEGLLLFNEFNPFSVSLTSNGFCKCSIDCEGFLVKNLFNQDGKEFYAKNCNSNREFFAKHLSPFGIMVSNCI